MRSSEDLKYIADLLLFLQIYLYLHGLFEYIGCLFINRLKSFEVYALIYLKNDYFLIVAFIDRNLREVFEDEDKSILVYGKNATIQLQNRLLDLFASESLGDLIVGNLRESRGNDTIRFLIDLDDVYELEFMPNHVNREDYLLEDIIQFSLVKRIKITSINRKL